MSQRFKWRSGVCQRNSKADDSLRGHENESLFPEKKETYSVKTVQLLNRMPKKMSVPINMSQRNMLTKKWVSVQLFL